MPNIGIQMTNPDLTFNQCYYQSIYILCFLNYVYNEMIFLELGAWRIVGKICFLKNLFYLNTNTITYIA